MKKKTPLESGVDQRSRAAVARTLTYRPSAVGAPQNPEDQISFRMTRHKMLKRVRGMSGSLPEALEPLNAKLLSENYKPHFLPFTACPCCRGPLELAGPPHYALILVVLLTNLGDEQTAIITFICGMCAHQVDHMGPEPYEAVLATVKKVVPKLRLRGPS